ncbi:MAG: ABC transporter ATP-binding protein [Candidatus Accumulibacter cognatus]|uniref:ABC transporter ATP-binding protein n=1 Tax=Candidatus Accumulibacter cognatus TaxID=2954383 RepID=A0A7D5SLG6_9PROT|nr:ABC transporter ATP-binding protein [Candidatus Accumulibacter phosphatis]QLH49203.1 MAG: ABC transporter ATP-binding protein [Candidatus Accumulibacter cognatus]
MSSDTAISVRNVSKTYRTYEHPLHALASRLSGGRVGRFREFHALSDVSIDIAKGESIGILGRNGSGKSTLLQVICGIRQATHGTVNVTGRISALLELGSGFHPDMTGRENVLLQGAIMGFTQDEMEARFDDIAAFADIGEYLDQPMNTFSSGMMLRLAFATAVQVSPDILIVDEALVVGDALFQKRCHAKIRRMRDSGLTLVLVSHDYEMVRNMTNRALLLDHGLVQALGSTRDVTRHYRKMLFEEEARLWAGTDAGTLPASRPEPYEPASSYGIGGATITGVRILGGNQQPCGVFAAGELISIEIATRIDAQLDHLNIGVVIRTLEGLKVYSWGSFNQDIAIWAGIKPGEVLWDRAFEAGDEVIMKLVLEGNLGVGKYEVQAVVSRELQKQYGAQQILHWRDEAGFFRVDMNPASYVFGGVTDLHGTATFVA